MDKKHDTIIKIMPHGIETRYVDFHLTRFVSFLLITSTYHICDSTVGSAKITDRALIVQKIWLVV